MWSQKFNYLPFLCLVAIFSLKRKLTFRVYLGFLCFVGGDPCEDFLLVLSQLNLAGPRRVPRIVGQPTNMPTPPVHQQLRSAPLLSPDSHPSSITSALGSRWKTCLVLSLPITPYTCTKIKYPIPPPTHNVALSKCQTVVKYKKKKIIISKSQIKDGLRFSKSLNWV